jgi:hypothetical protein
LAASHRAESFLYTQTLKEHCIVYSAAFIAI